MPPQPPPESLCFDAWCRQEIPALRRFLLRRGVSAADADDLVQDTLVVVWQKLGRIRPGRERSFLFGTAMRICMNHQRTKHRRHRLLEDDPGAILPAARPHCADVLAGQERRHALHAAIARLPARTREVVVSVEIEERSVTETARHCGISAKTVSNLLTRARRKLRQVLDGDR